MVLIAMDHLYLPIKMVFGLFVFTGANLFTFLGAMVYTMLNLIKKEMDFIPDDGVEGIEAFLRQCQRCHYLVGELVNNMGQCFGFVILLVLTFDSIWMVNGFFFVFVELKELGPTLQPFASLSFLLGGLSYFAFVSYIPHLVKEEVK